MLGLAALLLFVCADDRADVATLLQAGRQRDAAVIMERLLDEKPANLELRGDLVRLEMRIGRYSSALGHAESLGPEFDSTRGKALYLLGRYEEALAFLKSNDAESILFRHEALRVLTRFKEAKFALDQAGKLLGEDHVEVRVRRGQAFARTGEYEKAVLQFRPALKREPLSLAAMFGLGRALLALGEEEEGIAQLERHRRLTPLLDGLDFARANLELDLSHAPNHAALGDALRVLIEFDPRLAEDALETYATATRLAKGPQLIPIALRHARFVDEDLEDPEQAIAVLREALTRRNSAPLAVRAGDVSMRISKPEVALPFYWQAHELRPKDQMIARRLKAATTAIAKQKAK